MCGITGFVKHANSRKENWIKNLTKMANTMQARGPDDSGIWFDSNVGVGLAHRRLSIIDLSPQGHQPMISHSGRYVIVFNGEVYNYTDIRNQLDDQNIQWRGHSDTEVVLEAIETWGVRHALTSFIGMFAFALWDRQERRLTLARDRLGIKPLYYGYNEKCFFFGSELKPLMAHSDFYPKIDRNALALYFRHNCIPCPSSIFEGIQKLIPGTLLTLPIELLIEGRKLPEPEVYWSAKSTIERFQTDPAIINEIDAVDRLEHLLKDAVKQRMVSDVPVGAFLSGGVDSSATVALMQAQSLKKVKTFSIGLWEQDYNEAEFAKEIAAHIGTDHHELYVTPEDALDVIPDIPQLYDEPFSDTSQIPTFLLSKLTRDYVTVCLSGDGGDEVFGGYNRYFFGQNVWKHISAIHNGWRAALAKSLQHISPKTYDRTLGRLISMLPKRYKIDMIGDRIHKLSDIIACENIEAVYYRLVSHWKQPEQLVIDSIEPLTHITRPNARPCLTDYTHMMMFLDLITYLPDDILTKVDRASMGVGLEARVPLIDHRVVEFAWALPLNMKVRSNQGKWILRQILDRYVPKALIERPKTGFALPIDAWLRGSLRDWAEDLLSESKLTHSGLLNVAPIKQKWQEHLSGKYNWQYDLWDVLMFQAWADNYSL